MQYNRHYYYHRPAKPERKKIGRGWFWLWSIEAVVLVTLALAMVYHWWGL